MHSRKETRREECRTLVRLMEQATGSKPQMWGTSIVGFGSQTFQGASGATDWFVIGFSPRKQNLTLYLMSGMAHHASLLRRLGKHTTGKSCLYLKSLADADVAVLTELIEASVRQVRSGRG